jgi:hypothetical protein
MVKRLRNIGTLLVISSKLYSRLLMMEFLFFQAHSLNNMVNENVSKGKRVFSSILSPIYKCGQLPNSVFFSKVLPVLLYGSEIWGFKEYKCTELVHTLACKTLTCEWKNIKCLFTRECGRYPPYYILMCANWSIG